MNCPFCDFIARPQKHLFLAHLRTSLLFLHPDQYYLGRCLLIMSTHKDDVTELTASEFTKFTKDLYIAIRLLKQAFRPNRFNIAMLGNKTKHLHWHLFPRYESEPNFRNPPWPKPKTKVPARNRLQILHTVRSVVRKMELL